MNEWTSYRLQDFIPFTGEVYFRLLERMGEAFWPLQILTLALGGAALLWALNNRPRLAFLAQAVLLTLLILDAPKAVPLLTVLVIGVLGLVWKSVSLRRQA